MLHDEYAQAEIEYRQDRMLAAAERRRARRTSAHDRTDVAEREPGTRPDHKRRSALAFGRAA